MKLFARSSVLLAAFATLLTTGLFAASGDYDKPEVAHTLHMQRSPQPTFKIQSGIDGDVFPAFANYASLQTPDQRKWGVVSVQVSNSTDSEQRYRIAVRVPGW